MILNKDFFPTPREIIEQMIIGLNLKGKTVLEPSSGNGNIIEVLKEFGAKVICCEINEELASISSQKADSFLKHNFLDVQAHEISHVDYIISNPPFSKDEDHILHMWDIAPGGCQIISLCNWETIGNTYSNRRKSLKYLLKENGNFRNLGNVFSTAERNTDVQIGLIHLFKPSEGQNEFEGYFDMSEEFEAQENGIMKHSEIKEIVQRYVSAVNMFNSVIESTSKMNELISPISSQSYIEFGAFQRMNSYNQAINRDTFKKELQKSAWKSVFNKLNMEKYVTSSVMCDINKFVEQQVNVPFTVKNIYKMMEIIIGTQGQRMERIIVEAFDDITSRHYNNRYVKEGWKTNSEYMVNKKFIMGSYDFKMSWDGTAEASYLHGRSYFMDDLTKAICYTIGFNYKDCLDWYNFINNRQEYDRECSYRNDETRKVEKYTRKETKSFGREYGKWHEFNFVRFKVYKKGSMHVEFLDDSVWMEFNRVACKARGFELAMKYTSDFRRKETGVKKY